MKIEVASDPSYTAGLVLPSKLNTGRDELEYSCRLIFALMALAVSWLKIALYVIPCEALKNSMTKSALVSARLEA